MPFLVQLSEPREVLRQAPPRSPPNQTRIPVVAHALECLLDVPEPERSGSTKKHTHIDDIA